MEISTHFPKYNIKWIILIPAGLLLSYVLFATFIYIFILPIYGYALTLDSKTRTRGIFILIAFAYFLLNIFISIKFYGLPVWEYHIVVGWTLLAMDFACHGLCLPWTLLAMDFACHGLCLPWI